MQFILNVPMSADHMTDALGIATSNTTNEVASFRRRLAVHYSP